MFSTNDKALAVKMWEEIKVAIQEDETVDVEDLKEEFCTQHHLSWKCNCILCEEYNDKGRCLMQCPLKKKATEIGVPLETCGCTEHYDTDYAVASNEDNGYGAEDWHEYSLAERLKAVDNIIEAIQGVRVGEENN